MFPDADGPDIEQKAFYPTAPPLPTEEPYTDPIKDNPPPEFKERSDGLCTKCLIRNLKNYFFVIPNINNDVI